MIEENDLFVEHLNFGYCCRRVLSMHSVHYSNLQNFIHSSLSGPKSHKHCNLKMELYFKFYCNYGFLSPT